MSQSPIRKDFRDQLVSKIQELIEEYIDVETELDGYEEEEQQMIVVPRDELLNFLDEWELTWKR